VCEQRMDPLPLLVIGARLANSVLLDLNVNLKMFYVESLLNESFKFNSNCYGQHHWAEIIQGG